MLIVSVFAVAPEMMVPSFCHINENGPVPAGVVLKVAFSPGHFRRFANGVVEAFVLRTNIAQFVTLFVAPPQVPDTTTQ